MNEIKHKGIGNLFSGEKGGNFGGNIFDQNYLAPTLTTMRGGHTQPLIIVYEEDKNFRSDGQWH